MQILATSRALKGTGASRRLRYTGKTPGVVYGASSEPQSIELDHNSLYHALKKETYHSSILNLSVDDGESTPVVLRAVQYHPYKPLILHVDFQRVDENTKVEALVPVVYEGVDASPAVKSDNCTVTTLVNELAVVSVPAKRPEVIKVDLSGLTVKSQLGLRNLIKLPVGVKAVVRGSNKNPNLVHIKLPEVAVDTSAAAAAPAPAKKGKK